MKKKIKLLTVIMLSQAFSSMSLHAARLLEPLETPFQTLHLQRLKELKSDDLSTKTNLPKDTLEDHSSSYTNIRSALLYSVKVLSGITSSMLYEKYLSHYTVPGKIFTNVPRFGAALFGYMLPDMLDSTTGFSQKSSTSSEPFSAILKNSVASAGTYMSNYILSLSIDEAFAQLAYHGTLLWTADPLLANASYQGAKNLTYYTSATPTLLKAAKKTGSTILSNSVSSMKKWWYRKVA